MSCLCVSHIIWLETLALWPSDDGCIQCVLCGRPGAGWGWDWSRHRGLLPDSQGQHCANDSGERTEVETSTGTNPVIPHADTQSST